MCCYTNECRDKSKSKYVINGDIRLINIKLTDAQSGLIDGGQQLITILKRELEKAIFIKRIFNDNSDNKLYLDVRITKVISNGLCFSFKTEASYDLKDKRTDKTLLSKIVKSEGNSNTFYGAQRCNETTGRVIRDNNEKFIAYLEHFAALN